MTEQELLAAYGLERVRFLESVTDAEALMVLARRNRILAIVIPKGIPTEKIAKLKREVDAALDLLVAERGPLA